MARKCSFCRENAVYMKERKRFCKDHFNNYYLKKAEKIFYIGKIYGKKILAAVSGGKDSAALAYILNFYKEKFKLDVELLYIDLGIDCYSGESRKTVEEMAKKLGMKLNIVSAQLPAVKDKRKDVAVCSLCGTIKRYLFNKYAYENNFDFVATGHNLDDQSAFLLNNILSQEVQYIVRDNLVNPSVPELRLVGKIKPLYFLTEKENMLFCMTNGLNIFHGECPYAENNVQLKNKQRLLDMAAYIPNLKTALVKSMMKLKDEIKNDQHEINHVKQCIKCGYPTTTEICRYCRLTNEE